jgi:hypothetical protein
MNQLDNCKSAIKAAAFTRTELVFTIVAVIVVSSLLTACGSKANRQNDVARCKDNLKSIALALNLWMEDNDENRLPWRADYTPTPSPDPQRSECWFHLSSLSNQLESPKLLACPADKQTRVARTWDDNPTTGIRAPKFQDRACSYAIGFDVQITSARYPVGIPIGTVMNSMLLVDRHLGGKSVPEWCDYAKAGCSAFNNPFELLWTKDVHGSSFGNAAFLHGDVDTISNRLERVVQFNIDFAYLREPAHVLFPKRSEKH